MEGVLIVLALLTVLVFVFGIGVVVGAALMSLSHRSKGGQ